ncbi:low-specificity L-threonine aldolase [Inhella gelatinilytica]|uniref:Low-specificity L-threonine aldolase n=1 Tax=Inhella gelatinilytica TaxID=2795030 RepID=A0A931IYR6_9BURK|nr:low-specificity L-threonine aldolase [Inhella gelatinilytica]MBH9553559.1 low-specificity L-threonine aldolase [Inhella gelatinilytica]
MSRVIDLRSDTVTRPTAGMRAAMAAARLGDDVFGDDPSVNTLQAAVAERLGFEAALFLPSGTQSNLVALMSHCERGDEYIVGQQQHCYRWEAGGAAVLGSIQPQPLTQQADGSLLLADIEAAIKPDDPHFARTRLLCLENTIGGQVLDPAYVRDAQALARRHGLGLHLDGARLFNAAAAAPGEVLANARAICAGFDSVSVCFSKGLGAPVGSVLCGSHDFIARARRWRKMCGGAMRQAGLLAAAAQYALDHHLERLREDHALAQRLASGLQGIPGVQVQAPQTNIVFADVAPARSAGLIPYLKEHGVLATGLYRLRFVTHLDVDEAGVDRAITAVRSYFCEA